LFPTFGGEACAIAIVEKHIADRIINNLIINSSSPPPEIDLFVNPLNGQNVTIAAPAQHG
jgi:hypothetical protein